MLAIGQVEAQPLVIIATRGRASVVAELLSQLERQSLAPVHVVVVGAGSEDLPTSVSAAFQLDMISTGAPGLTRQRNAGVALLRHKGLLQRRGAFVVFFDDDFRPAKDWLAEAARALDADPDLTGLTGLVVADGVKDRPISEADAHAYLLGLQPPRPHWSQVKQAHNVESLYGCNMAISTAAVGVCHFDEELPLYGWQEDCDYSGQLRRLGKTQIIPACRGVHLGSRSGRVSGVRMGYSQVANPIWISKKGNMTRLRMIRFIARAFASNIIKSLLRVGNVDHWGRLRGNMLALQDLVVGRCRPEHVTRI